MVCIRGARFPSDRLHDNRLLLRCFQVLTVWVGCLLVVGCGAPEGPARFPLTGNVVRESQPIADGTIQITPTGGGPAASTFIKAGKYHFTRQNGPVEGKHTVTITRLLQREEVPPGTPKKDANYLPETGFKKPMPPGGWQTETAIKKDQDPNTPVNFDVDGAIPAVGGGGRKDKQ